MAAKGMGEQDESPSRQGASATSPANSGAESAYLDESGHNNASKGRRSSIKMPGLLKRAVSSPNVRNLAAGDLASISADKKRSKLGYHRTAVACGHCRRRKIRCIPAYEDVTGRCQNCIRLKKECHFFPVDQQVQPPGRRPRAGSKVETSHETDTSVSSSSPGLFGSGQYHDSLQDIHSRIHTPLPSQNATFPGLQKESSFENAGNTTAVFRPAASQILEGPYTKSPPLSSEAFDNPHDHYFSNHDPQTLRGSYTNSPFGSTSYSGSMTTSPQSKIFPFQQTPSSSEHFTWAPQPLSRSMSIADTDDLRNVYAAYNRQNSYPSIARRMDPDIMQLRQQQSAPTTGSNIQYGTMNGAYQDYHNYSNTSQQPGTGWASSMPPPIPRHPMAASEAYSQSWYASAQPGLAHVQEEEQAGMYAEHVPGQQPFQPNPG